MENFDYSSLKSGTDVRGVAYGKKEDITLTDERVMQISKAFAQFVRDKFNKKNITIAVGNDPRLSSSRLKESICNALSFVGVHVFYVGLASTPAMFMVLKEQNLTVDASIMITASHLPMDKNGMKFFLPSGGLESVEISKLLEMAQKQTYSYVEGGSVFNLNYMPVYSKILRDKIIKECGDKLPLKGMKIVVDAGNGSGGFYARDVLEPLGADISNSQFLEPDGNFPNHIPNPENKEAMDSISKKVVESNSDLGIIFDTDVDRAAIVSKDGEEINRNRLIALISAVLLKEKEGTIVTDSITSIGLQEFIEGKGGEHFRYKRGYKNVIDKAIELNYYNIYTPLAIETSGHAALMENYFLDDGAYLVTRLLIAAANLRKEGKELTSLIDDLKEPSEAVEIRMTFNTEDFKLCGKNILEKLKKYAEENFGMRLETPNYEGVRVNFDSNNGNGWLLLRLSLHDPIMPLNIESDSIGGTKIIAKQLYDFLVKFDEINIENLEKYIKE